MRKKLPPPPHRNKPRRDPEARIDQLLRELDDLDRLLEDALAFVDQELAELEEDIRCLAA